MYRHDSILHHISSSMMSRNLYGLHFLQLLAFLCESHIHSLMNVLRYCNLDESQQREDSLICHSALERLSKTWELDYMSYIVLRMFENTMVVALEDPKRYRIEMAFSRGADLSPLEFVHLASSCCGMNLKIEVIESIRITMVKLLHCIRNTLPIMGPERLQEVGSYLTLEKMENIIRPFTMPAEDFPPPAIPQGFSGYFRSAGMLECLVNL
ncbi:hypothetical protein IFM89_036133 [Coptis chinensis]|uniref:Uncharacterized protein n=1 Tax=Coptis chinensis TaxID=261450 RepID=A0A835HSH1_9MAGN|nr:hypothetical protein IFM89_036133 [Coptis chinensis]